MVIPKENFAANRDVGSVAQAPRVESIVVAPRERAAGLGRALFVAGLRTLLASHPEQPVSLWVRSDNAPALGLYRSLGFETKSEDATWHRMPASKQRSST